MWRKIGIKDYSSDRSVSQVSNDSSERRYRRRRPYNEADSIDHVENHFSRVDYFDDKEKEKEVVEEKEKVQPKKDKQLVSFLDKNHEFRKTTSLLKLNSQISDPMHTSVNINNLFRSGSLKVHQYQPESPTNLKAKRKQSDSIPRLHESLVVEQEGLYEQIHRLNNQLKKQRRINTFLRERLNQYKIIYQQIDLEVKQQLYNYYQIQKNMFMDVEAIFHKITFRTDELYLPQTISTSNSVPEFTGIEMLESPKLKAQNNKDHSISIILGTIQQMKNRILQKTIIQVSTPKSSHSHGGGYSPRSDKKRSVLPAVAEFEELFDR